MSSSYLLLSQPKLVSCPSQGVRAGKEAWRSEGEDRARDEMDPTDGAVRSTTPTSAGLDGILTTKDESPIQTGLALPGVRNHCSSTRRRQPARHGPFVVVGDVSA